jgi:8-oxo-dGTP diphosphatase
MANMTNSQLPREATNYPLPRYSLVPRALCFVTSGRDVLLLKGAPNKKLWAGKYNGLGGHVERGESVYAAARREIMEEAGLAAIDLQLRGVVTIDVQAGPGIGLFVFTATAPSREVTASAEGALAWVPRDQVAALETVEDLPILLPLLFSLPPGAPPFGGHYSYAPDGGLQMKFFSEQMGADRPL